MDPLSDDEKQQVAQLRSQLTEVTQEAQVPEGYLLWNVPLDKESNDPRLDILLVKFLRARDHDLIKATKMLTDTLIWRKAFKADEILDERFDESLFSSVGYLHKTDREGRPVCYNFYGDLDQEKVFGDVEKFIRWRVQLMEKGVQHIDFIHVDSMIQVHDYQGASMFGRSQNSKNATKEIIKIMQDNYPEFLVTKYFVHVPWWGSTIFKLVRPLLSEATFKKFVVCSSDEIYRQLTKAIPQDNLPEVYRSLGPKAAPSEQAVAPATPPTHTITTVEPDTTHPAIVEASPKAIAEASPKAIAEASPKAIVEASPKDSMEIEQVVEPTTQNQ
ncbi:CRAL-TRIO domain-containing protein [Sporodiniella umbellata]|nr:CRAL-TRIO domain-containing protein [Sporodiniella umbellata]